MINQKLLTFCSSCGHKFGRSGNGTQTETSCPKCGAGIEYEVNETTVIVKLLKPSTKRHSKYL